MVNPGSTLEPSLRSTVLLYIQMKNFHGKQARSIHDWLLSKDRGQMNPMCLLSSLPALVFSTLQRQGAFLAYSYALSE